jgi:protein TonB
MATILTDVPSTLPEVFSARDIALAAGVSTARARALMASGVIDTIDGRFALAPEAARAVRRLRDADPSSPTEASLFRPRAPERRARSVPLAASAMLHFAIVAALAALTSIGTASPVREVESKSDVTRLVFRPTPGPGGGGGGGGLLRPVPARRAELKGRRAVRSPVTIERAVRAPEPKPAERITPPPRVEPAPRPVEPSEPERKPDPPPPVVAPVATIAADAKDRPGVITDEAPESDSRGRGAGGGAGSGDGTGLGEGTGPGIGPGTGGGSGGGPYRPGSGITPPSLLREIKPDYTEDARRRGIEGDVMLEIVVRRDGSVGDIRLVRRLDGGLDQRAIDAVRQWRFSPARRSGTPVDVVVEVAVEFKLR